MKQIYILIAIVLFSSIDDVHSQRKNRRPKPSTNSYYSELGGSIGISNFQGDFYNKGLENGRITVNGFSVKGTYSIHKIPRRKSLIRRENIMNHLMLKANIAYTNGSFDNLGISTGQESIAGPKIQNYILLGRLTAKTNVLTVGTQLEYYFKDLYSFLHRNNRQYNNNIGRRVVNRNSIFDRGTPYVGFGFGLNYINSSYDYNDDLFERGLYPDNYVIEVYRGINKIILSTTFAVGYRYKINTKIDFTGELKVNYYFSDRIDAINTDPSPVIKNEFNDYNTVISIGAVYHFFR